MDSVPSLTVQTILNLLPPDKLQELYSTLNKKVYRYLLVATSMETADIADIKHLREVMVKTADELIDILYQDDKVIKLLCGYDFFEDEYPDVISNIKTNFELFGNVDNAKELAKAFRKLVKSSKLEKKVKSYIAEITDFSVSGAQLIFIFNREFDNLFIKDNGKHFTFEKKEHKTELYSYHFV